MRAKFDPVSGIVGIGDYLAAHPENQFNSEVIAALPASYRRNWISMPRSESLQTGAATAPRSDFVTVHHANFSRSDAGRGVVFLDNRLTRCAARGASREPGRQRPSSRRRSAILVVASERG